MLGSNKVTVEVNFRKDETSSRSQNNMLSSSEDELII